MEEIKRISRDLVAHGAIIDYYQDTMQIPNGHVARWDFIKHKGAAAVVPVDDQGRIIMVRQYRNALERYTLEIPAGGLQTAEEPTRDAAARELQEETGMTFIHPYDDEQVIAGQGTIGLEILDQLPDVDAVIVPVGGGGLISGVAFAIKSLKPDVKVYGVQAEGADAIARSYRAGKLVTTESASTIADGIAVKAPGDITVPLIQKYADDVVTVNDLEISEAVLLLMERCKQIVEPSGAAPVAAVLKGKVDVKGKNVVCLLSGGNIDVSFIQCIIEQGLVSRHRRLRFTVTLLDRPGSLGKLLNDIAALGANILSVEHDRLTAGLNPNEIDVHVSCEVGGKEHGDRVLDQLIQNGYHVKID